MSEPAVPLGRPRCTRLAATCDLLKPQYRLASSTYRCSAVLPSRRDQPEPFAATKVMCPARSARSSHASNAPPRADPIWVVPSGQTPTRKMRAAPPPLLPLPWASAAAAGVRVPALLATMASSNKKLIIVIVATTVWRPAAVGSAMRPRRLLRCARPAVVRLGAYAGQEGEQERQQAAAAARRVLAEGPRGGLLILSGHYQS
jgi:hypothetical protein